MSDIPMNVKPEGYYKLIFEKYTKQILFYIMVVLVVIWCTFPLVWAFIQSFVNPATRSLSVEYIPSDPSLYNYEVVFEVFQFQKYILNSFFLSLATTLLCVAFAAFSAYVLAQFSFKGKDIILILILSMTMFPGIIIVVPLFRQYLIINDIIGYNLVNTFPGLLIPYIAFNMPLTVFLLYNFFQEIPRELILAARVDGASHFQVFYKVILPLAIPGVFTTCILVFIAAWNEYLFASILISDVGNWTIPVALALFTGIPPSGGQTFDQFLSLMAASVLVTVPLVILVLIFQKQIVSGITAGAVKG